MEDERWQSPFEQEEEENRSEEEEGFKLVQVTSEDFIDFDSELENIQKLDPMRNAFDQAATAEDFSNYFQGIVELWRSRRTCNDSLPASSCSVTMGNHNEAQSRGRLRRRYCMQTIQKQFM